MSSDSDLEQKPYLTPKEAAEIMGYSVPRIRQMLQHGTIRGKKLEDGRKWAIPREELLPDDPTIQKAQAPTNGPHLNTHQQHEGSNLPGQAPNECGDRALREKVTPGAGGYLHQQDLMWEIRRLENQLDSKPTTLRSKEVEEAALHDSLRQHTQGEDLPDLLDAYDVALRRHGERRDQVGKELASALRRLLKRSPALPEGVEIWLWDQQVLEQLLLRARNASPGESALVPCQVWNKRYGEAPDLLV